MSTIDNLCPHGGSERFFIYLHKYFCNKTKIGTLHCLGCFYLIFPFLANNIFTEDDIQKNTLKRHSGGLWPLGKKKSIFYRFVFKMGRRPGGPFLKNSIKDTAF